MKRSRTIVIFFLLMVAFGIEAAVLSHPEKIAFPDKSHSTIFLSNHYPELIKPVALCIYLYKNAKKDTCQTLTESHPNFIFSPNLTWVQIQRIVFRGEILAKPGDILSCIAYQGRGTETLDSLEHVTHARVEINYVDEQSVVCSLNNDF